MEHNFKEDPGCHGDKSIFDYNGPMQGVNRDQYAVSKPVSMSTNMKYEIVIEYFHSVHDKYEENSDSFATLSWECEKIKEEVIPTKYYYKQDKAAPLKMTGFKEKEVMLDIL